jgi:uncharacterized protein YbaA (DUF1428 family)
LRARRIATASTRRSWQDPQLKESMDPSKMPFDGKRMFWGGFQSIIGLAAGC